MSPAVVASRLDYQNKLVPIDRVLHALLGKSCGLEGSAVIIMKEVAALIILASKVKTQ